MKALHTAPTIIHLRIKQSKIDPFRLKVDVFLGATQADMCPVQAMIQYLSLREPDAGPLFISQNGVPVTHATLVKELQEALQQEGISASQ